MIGAVLDLFPESAAFADGGLAIGGIRATELADEFGTPLVVFCEQTLRAQARVPAGRARRARRLRLEGVPEPRAPPPVRRGGLGADVSTLGELELARRAGIPGERLVVHGNNKSDEELRAAAEAPRPRWSSSTRRTRSSGRRRPVCAASSCG